MISLGPRLPSYFAFAWSLGVPTRGKRPNDRFGECLGELMTSPEMAQLSGRHSAGSRKPANFGSKGAASRQA
jgi:hypothetical protein